MVGQHLPGRRGRRRLAPLLVLVQVARLDPHPRQAGRAAEVPRGDRRRVRAASAPPPRRRGRVGDVGRRPPRLDRRASTTAPPTSATCSSAASGSSTSPATPTGPGSTTSTGPKFHTSRWEHEHDLTDKVVAVVGTGSTATQIVPAIQPDRAARSTCSSASRAGSCPRATATSPPEERKRFSNRWRRRQERLRLKWLLEKNIWGGKVFRGRHQGERGAHAVLPRLHRPELRGPSRPARGGHPDATRIPGKRPIFAIDLLSRAQGAERRAGPEGGRVGDAAPAIVDVDGVERAVDVLVMATGFQPADYLARLQVVGRDRDARCRSTGPASRTRSSASPSRSSPTSSSSTDRAPTAARSSPCSRASRSTRCGRCSACAASASPRSRCARSSTAGGTAGSSTRCAGTSWTMSNNYFKAPTGKVVTQWPIGCTVYRALTKVFGRVSETTRRRQAR